MPATRDEIVQLLSAPRSLPADHHLVLVVADYLQDNFDPEMIERAEACFGAPISTLRNIASRCVVPDFSHTWRGTSAWLERYLKLTEENEAPSIYHAMAALTVASATMGRKFWIDQSFYKIFPPMATILVGPSGLRKSTAIYNALFFLSVFDDVKVVRDKVTPEALIETLRPASPQDDALGIIVASEMSITFGKQHYLHGMVPLITGMLDHDKVSLSTRGRGNITLERIGLAMLAGTTPKWIIDEMNTSVISGGFTSRLLFSFEKATSRVYFKSKQVDMKELLSLRNELLDCMKGAGEVQLTTLSQHLLEEWYRCHKARSDIDELQSGYHNRKMQHIMRISMVFAVLAGKRQIEREHLWAAAELIRHIEPGMFELFEELSKPQSAVDSDKAIALIEAAGGSMSRKDFVRTLGKLIPVKRIKETVEYLTASGVVKIVHDDATHHDIVKVL